MKSELAEIKSELYVYQNIIDEVEIKLTLGNSEDIQNAIVSIHPKTSVATTTYVAADRLLIDVQKVLSGGVHVTANDVLMREVSEAEKYLDDERL